VQLEALLAGVARPSIRPGIPEGVPHLKKLAMQMVTMQANGDRAGVADVVAAVREAREIPDPCGDLTTLAIRALCGNLVQVVDQ